MKVKFIKISNVSETFKIFFYYAKIGGFALFSPKKRMLKGKIGIKLIDIFLIKFYLVLYSGTGFFLPQLKFTDDSSSIEDVFLVVALSGAFSFAVLSTIFCFIFRHQLWCILKNFHIFDDQIKLIGTSFDYNNHALITIVFIVFGEIVINANIFLLSNPSIQSYFCIYVPNHGYLVLMNSVVLILLAVLIRLRAFNNTFKVKFLPSKNWIQVRELKYLVSYFGKMYGDLNDCLDLINFFFGFQTLLYTSVYMIFSVFTIFSVYRGFIHPDENSKELLFYIAWETFYSIFVFTVIYFGNKIQKEVYANIITSVIINYLFLIQGTILLGLIHKAEIISTDLELKLLVRLQ